MLPVSATLSTEAGSQSSARLVLVPPRHLVAVAAAGFVALAPAHHDRGGVVPGRLAVEQTLVAAGGVAADDADRLQLVHHLGDRHQVAHRAEWLAAEVGVGPGQDHPHAPAGEQRGHGDDVGVEELGLVDGDELRSPGAPAGRSRRRNRPARHPARCRRGWRRRRGPCSGVEMRLEDLHPSARDDAAPHAPDQLFALAGEHDAADHLDPAGARAVVHRRVSGLMGRGRQI